MSEFKKSSHHSGANSAYKLAFTDEKFMRSPEVRGMRIQLEIVKAECTFKAMGVKHTVAVIGSARFKSKQDAQALLDKAVQANDAAAIKAASKLLENAHYYHEAEMFGALVAQRNLSVIPDQRITLLTGGGPGIMEAANKGAFEQGDLSIGMNIVLPFEQEPNAYITPELCLDFYYFATRKFSYVNSGATTYGTPLVAGKGFVGEPDATSGGTMALVCFPGGFGTLDEMFEIVTLIQTKKMRELPIVLVGSKYWDSILNMHAIADAGVISEEDLRLFKVVDTAEQAWTAVKEYYALD